MIISDDSGDNNPAADRLVDPNVLCDAGDPMNCVVESAVDDEEDDEPADEDDEPAGDEDDEPAGDEENDEPAGDEEGDDINHVITQVMMMTVGTAVMTRNITIVILMTMNITMGTSMTRSIPMRTSMMRSIPMRTSMMRSIPMRTSMMRSIPMRTSMTMIRIYQKILTMPIVTINHHVHYVTSV